MLTKRHTHKWTVHSKANVITVYVAPNRHVPVDGSGWESNGPVADKYWTWDECDCGDKRRSESVPSMSVMGKWHRHPPDFDCVEGC